MSMTGKTIVVTYAELFEWQFDRGALRIVTIYYLEYLKNAEL